MRFSHCSCLVRGLCWLPLFVSLSAAGQSNLPRVAGGVFGSAGGLLPLEMTVLSAGGYVEAARFRFRPGVEVRGTVGDAGERLVLAGPRIARVIPGGNVYAAGLFGPSHSLNAAGTKEISGVTTEVALGVERNLGSHVRWRMLEVNVGFFSGSSGVQTFNLSTGIVLHFH